ncbi:MAG: hypothetical protein L0956_05330, partial [Candidatus Mariimomonas ferrooxydans]
MSNRLKTGQKSRHNGWLKKNKLNQGGDEMRRRELKIEKKVCITLVLALFIVTGCSISEAKNPNIQHQAMSADLDDQTGIALTVYNVNLGLVKDVREIKLGRGIGRLKFMDVASKIIPAISTLPQPSLT